MASTKKVVEPAASNPPDDVEAAKAAGDPAAAIVPSAEGAKAQVLDDDAENVPKMNLLSIFLLFLGFGVRAFGGPVAQINMMREELVTKAGWITNAKFMRVYAVYQVLPGPEATEIACYFGLLAGGRLGAVLGGLGFILPGFGLMLLAAYLYEQFGLNNNIVRAVFSAIQPAICALLVKACHKLGEAACRDPATKQLDWRKLLLVATAAFDSVLNVNFFITKVHNILVFIPLRRGPTPFWRAVAAFGWAAPLAIFIGVIIGLGPMRDLIPMGVGAAQDLGNTYAAHFVVGLLGGLVTFGGAYTAIPFMQYEAVTDGGWVPNELFLDSIAICSLMPTPLVMFSTMVGYGAGGVPGAVLMTLGMFLPAFSFTVIGHELFERVANHKGIVSEILDSVSATVVGLVAITALQFLRASIVRPLDAVIFVGSLQAIYTLTHPFTPVFVILAAALAGEVLFN